MFADQTMVVAVPARQSRRDVKKDQASTTMSHREIDTAHRTNQTVAVELGADDGESDPPIQLKRFFLLLRPHQTNSRDTDAAAGRKKINLNSSKKKIPPL
jgi:hypothetical protein